MEDSTFIVDFYSQLNHLKKEYEVVVQSVNQSREKCQNLTIDIREAEKKREEMISNLNFISSEKSKSNDHELELQVTLENKSFLHQKIKRERLKNELQLESSRKNHLLITQELQRIVSGFTKEVNSGELKKKIFQEIESTLQERIKSFESQKKELSNLRNTLESKKSDVKQKINAMEVMKTKEIIELQAKKEQKKKEFDVHVINERKHIINQNELMEKEKQKFRQFCNKIRVNQSELNKINKEINTIEVQKELILTKENQIKERNKQLEEQLSVIFKKINFFNHKNRGFVQAKYLSQPQNGGNSLNNARMQNSSFHGNNSRNHNQNQMGNYFSNRNPQQQWNYNNIRNQNQNQTGNLYGSGGGRSSFNGNNINPRFNNNASMMNNNNNNNGFRYGGYGNGSNGRRNMFQTNRLAKNRGISEVNRNSVSPNYNNTINNNRNNNFSFYSPTSHSNSNQRNMIASNNNRNRNGNENIRINGSFTSLVNRKRNYVINHQHQHNANEEKKKKKEKETVEKAVRGNKELRKSIIRDIRKERNEKIKEKTKLIKSGNFLPLPFDPKKKYLTDQEIEKEKNDNLFNKSLM